MNFGVVILIIVGLNGLNGAKILGIFPVPARSHYILGNALLRGLAERGHDVTMISTFVEKNPPKNGSYRDIVVEGLLEEHESRRQDMNMFEMGERNVFLMVPFFVSMILESTEFTLKSPGVHKLINSDEEFDLVIVEQFMNEALKGFASRFKAPLILMSTIGANSWVNLLVGNPSPPSYIPDVFLSYSSDMTFGERLFNCLWTGFSHLMYNFYMYPKQGELYKKYFPNGPEWNDVLYNASLVLLNSHASTNQPVPYVPNMIDIGGYHVQPPKKLPQDLQQFLDSAKDGVIYFSMGSHLHSSDLPAEKRDALLKAFAKLKQKVLWKFETDDLPGKPENVKLRKWLPQQDILAHPNVKLFISHGGLLSTVETIYHGVPVLVIPIAGDQKLNAENIVKQGFGLKMSYKDISEQALTKTLNELLTNPKYTKNAKTRSSIFHDRLTKPMDTAAYWVEYIVRHGGAPHLRVAGVDLPLYKYLLLDIIAFVAVIGLVLLFTSYVIGKKLISLIFKKKQKVKKS